MSETENNLSLYEKFRSVPASAKKEIKGGRLSGKTDINPMWRIKKLTEIFGPCGIGWTYSIKKQWLEASGEEIAAFCDIDLFVKYDGEWSQPIPGTGGSMFVAKESKGLYVSDECYKMALTDALSVACKALGIGADVYWDADATKYPNQPPTPDKAGRAGDKPAAAPSNKPGSCKEAQRKRINTLVKEIGYDKEGYKDYKALLAKSFPKATNTKDLSEVQADQLIVSLTEIKEAAKIA